jgi:hypothetical protein
VVVGGHIEVAVAVERGGSGAEEVEEAEGRRESKAARRAAAWRSGPELRWGPWPGGDAMGAGA